MAEQQTVRGSIETTDPTAGNGSPHPKPKSAKAVKKSAGKSKPKVGKGRSRGRKPYPIIPFEQALRFGEGVGEVGAGHPVKRATLLEKLKLTVTQATKDLITASNKYGITKGSHDAEEFSLTTEGVVAAASNPSAERNCDESNSRSPTLSPSRDYTTSFVAEKCRRSRQYVTHWKILTWATEPRASIFSFRTRSLSEFYRRGKGLSISLMATTSGAQSLVLSAGCSSDHDGSEYAGSGRRLRHHLFLHFANWCR